MKDRIKAFIKNIYYLIPLKKQLFDVIKKYYVPPRSLYRFLVHRQVFSLNVHGNPLRIKHPGFHFYIENEFYWKGYTKSGFEAISRELWMQLALDASVVFDIGANTGLYSLFASLVNNKSDIHAFEPIIRNAQKLRYNIGINNMKNIQIVEAAISSTDGTTMIYQPDTDVSTTSTLDAETARDRQMDMNATEVTTYRIDSYIRKNNIAKVDLIKIDVEGFEVPVFEGMADILKTMQPTILAEIRVEENGSKIMELLQGCDYLFFDIDEKTTPRQVDEISRSSNNNFLICTADIAKNLKLIP